MSYTTPHPSVTPTPVHFLQLRKWIRKFDSHAVPSCSRKKSGIVSSPNWKTLLKPVYSLDSLNGSSTLEHKQLNSSEKLSDMLVALPVPSLSEVSSSSFSSSPSAACDLNAYSLANRGDCLVAALQDDSHVLGMIREASSISHSTELSFVKTASVASTQVTCQPIPLETDLLKPFAFRRDALQGWRKLYVRGTRAHEWPELNATVTEPI